MAWYSAITNSLTNLATKAKNVISSALNIPVYSIRVGHLLVLSGAALTIYYAPGIYQQTKEHFYPEPIVEPEPPEFLDKAIEFGKDQLLEMAEQLYKTYNKLWYVSIISTMTLAIATLKNTVWNVIEDTRLGKGLSYLASLNPLRRKDKSNTRDNQQQKLLELAKALSIVQAHVVEKDNNVAYMISSVTLPSGEQHPLIFTLSKDVANTVHGKLGLPTSIEVVKMDSKRQTAIIEV